MHCYRVYTPLWLWYWPCVHNVLQRIAWGKKILLHSKAVRRQGRRLSEQKPWRVQPEMQGMRTGSHAVGDWSEDLWKAWRATLRNVSPMTCVRRRVAQAEAWLGTWCHMDSRTLMAVQVRGVSTMEEREGRWMWGRWHWAAQESPVGCGCTRGVLCNKKQDYEPNLKLCRVILQQIHETRDILETRPGFAVRLLCSKSSQSKCWQCDHHFSTNLVIDRVLNMYDNYAWQCPALTMKWQCLNMGSEHGAAAMDHSQNIVM